ncbi:MAG TPA: AMP-binding protein, partial [Candidatus Baltobacteraceae bacterium]|nr:AMP-binding protein [Candidatus Baltobacteraceae bacterium]
MNATDRIYVGAKLLTTLRSQWWPSQRIRDYQARNLVRMMRYAATRVPYYRRLRLNAENLVSAADLLRFPLVNKREIQREPEAFLAPDPARVDAFSSRTSGSSGEPTTTYFDRRAWLLSKHALKMRRVAMTAGLSLPKRVMIISEQTPEELHRGAHLAGIKRDLLFGRRRLSIHTAVDEHVEEIERYRPHVIYAFPSYLLDLIGAAERLGRGLPQIATLCTSSEVLTPATRARIERAFGGRLYDVYGSTEFKEVAWQCRAGRYHTNFESVYVEPRPADTPAPVVLTTLCNLTMPLLRFDIGDQASFTDEPCPCGRAGQTMQSFLGREGDTIALPSGRRVSPYVLTTA